MTTSLPEDSPVGFGFRPTDEEIMNHYLRLKMIGKDSEVDNGIAEVDDICTFDPWELPPKSKIKSNDQIWWFFTRRDPERKTTKRKTKTGSWGLTGEEGQIKGRDGRVLGKKKYVVFFTGHTRGRRSNWVIREYHPLPENVLPKQRHYVICRLENKTDEKAGLTSCDEGEPSCNISSEVEMAPSAISEVHGHAEGNAESPSQLVFSPDDFLTEVEMNSIFEDCLNDDQKTQFVHENHPNPENSLPHQMPDLTCCLESKTDENSGTLGCNIGEPSIEIRAAIENPVAHAAISEWPYLTCCLENRTDEYVGSLDCNIGRPSSDITSVIENQVAPTAIPVVHGDTEVNAELLSQTFLTPDHYATEKDISLILSNSLSDDHHNEWHALCGAAEPETSPAEFLDQRKADPYESYYEESETTNDLFNNFIQPKSLKRPHFPDIPASNDTNAGGVNGRVKRPRSLAFGV